VPVDKLKKKQSLWGKNKKTGRSGSFQQGKSGTTPPSSNGARDGGNTDVAENQDEDDEENQNDASGGGDGEEQLQLELDGEESFEEANT
jgi:hypothetical protein